MPKLFDVPDLAEDVAAEDEVVEYGRSWAFDFIAGDFVNIGGVTPETEGHRAWADWCVKTVLTQRWAFIIYPDDYGTDLDEVRSASGRSESETLIENEIVDALSADPRTDRVHDFDFEWQGDSCVVTFAVEPSEGSSEVIKVDLTGVS